MLQSLRNNNIVKIKSSERNVIVCSSAMKVLKDDVVEVVKTVKGSELVGLTYETCFPELSEQNFEHKIVAWDEVSAEDGSGAVHIAPGCGAEDFELGQKLGLENVCPIDDGGIFYDNFGLLSSPFLCSTLRESCASAITGTPNSNAIVFKLLESLRHFID